MAQLSTADVFKSTEITWYGLDFSNIRLVGAEGFNDPDDIKNRFFNSWNNLVIGEPDKYDISKYFYKSSVENDLSVVKERNKLPNASDLVTENSYSFGEDKVTEIIADYPLDGKEGIGLVFIMGSFNKPDKKGYMWVTFFDMGNNTVLLTKKMRGKAKGFGFRNYWAATYYNVMKSVGKKKWSEWKAEQ